MSSNEDILAFIDLNIDECYELKLNKTEFQKGIKYGSYLSGIVSCLFNSGMESNEIKDIICTIISQKDSIDN